MMSVSSLESFVETIDIFDVKAHLTFMLAEHFHPSEQERRRQQPVQSIAGRIALKTAVCGLAKKYFPTLCLSQRDVVIDTASDGAPVITDIFTEDEAAAALLKSAVFVSISHSRTRAAGMACIATRGGC
jgi:phosphopantetheinyl transferase (holo-ACP synthase)